MCLHNTFCLYSVSCVWGTVLSPFWIIKFGLSSQPSQDKTYGKPHFADEETDVQKC